MTKVKLPKYQSIKIVEAAKIAKIEGQVMLLSFRKHGTKVEVDQTYLDKHQPQVGGYFVRYENGYESYSPKEPFESGYLSVETTIHAAKTGASFGIAIEMLKDGHRVARKGWNGKGMFLRMVSGKQYDVACGIARDLELAPWIGMKTADGKFVPWLASQTDMLAEDWVIVEVAQ
ncbi:MULTISPECIES: DUF2829 domain-containing protein [Klebsiella]|uniref:DUF2829 domain-containing protein n=1 Tax=Klebsiella TaxID=570 RepID=UPI0007CC9285|nr:MULTISPECIES: DUF2829 domain-containing protein [Klebsiella]MCS0552113.1 DUF2829 domain-containing protein [Klebsiella pneumoniae]MCS4329600.1 DUF2829 domain-containing protein [Klebsiella pneumoniae]UWA22719.1 DUF2829 domain-containing protein [Klebsiella pneumoniae]SAQ48480.1 Protein of uncharacterised function (DUF2829) [Klebsiella oxytoca]